MESILNVSGSEIIAEVLEQIGQSDKAQILNIMFHKCYQTTWKRSRRQVDGKISFPRAVMVVNMSYISRESR